MSSPFALLSTSDKTGLPDLGRALVTAGYTLLSTGGTAKVLREAGLDVRDVSEHTGAAEMMNGRVKTLHPRIHGGILGDRERHAEEAASHDIPWIDVVVCNLYPFESTVAAGATTEQAIETIDIGGPSMVRAAAKNHQSVTVVVDPSDYPQLIEALRGAGVSLELRRTLALKAFQHTSRYDAVIADWLAKASDKRSDFPSEHTLGLRRKAVLRYGENPHQQAAFYADPGRDGRTLGELIQHQGKALSFNNLADLDGAIRVVFEHDDPACAIIKHMNPAGCATAPDLPQAFDDALAGDPISAFGGIVAFNRPVDGPTVQRLRQSRTFFEVLVAPGFDEDALERLKPREKLRVIELPADWARRGPVGRDARRIQGGWLIQDWDIHASFAFDVKTKRAPTPDEEAALRFAWASCRGVKSNAIVLARPTATGMALNGVGAGQMSRVDSVHLAIRKATREVAGSALASDAFFPFADGIQGAAEAGITAIIQPGGSIRDDEVIAAADAANIAMVFTGTRHFRH
ncbi:MAG: bifunctional phosphoribosylaminoimidazolecarboxamide formyltransferase/IMP cyclohydrolase [Myxococcota bacterium]